MNEITIGDKTYISSKRAAEITGYAKDYVGQLCREGYVDAKMVGRSWYVYEASIRAHRFGEEAGEETPEEEQPTNEPENDDTPIQVTQEVRTTEILTTWEEPRYKAEEVVQIPSLDIRSEGSVNRLAEAEYEPEAALTDMQKAWKEWFELRNQKEPEPEGENETEDEPEEAVFEEEEVVELHRIHEPEEEYDEIEEPEEVEEVRIERIYRQEVVQKPVAVEQIPSAVRAVAAKPKRSAAKKKSSGGSAISIAAMFIAIAIVSVTIAAIGSGVATPYLQSFVGNNPVVEYLGGSRTINN